MTSCSLITDLKYHFKYAGHRGETLSCDIPIADDGDLGVVPLYRFDNSKEPREKLSKERISKCIYNVQYCADMDCRGYNYQYAIRALGAIREVSAIPALADALKGQNNDDEHDWLLECARRDASGALVEIGAPAVPALIELAKNGGADVPYHATWALMHINDPRIDPVLIELVEKGDKETQATAAEALGARKTASAAPVLIKALKSDNVGLRIESAKALGEIRDPSAVSALAAALKDENEHVQWTAIIALYDISTHRKITNASTIAAVVGTLNHKNERMRGYAINTLYHTKDASAVPALIGRMTDKNEDKNLRRHAAEALGEIGDASAVPALAEALKDKDIRGSAIEALVKIGKPAVPALIEALKNENKDVRWIAATALGDRGDASAIPTLIEALEEEKHWVRQITIEALVKIGKPAVPALKEAQKNEKTQSIATEALERIEKQAGPHSD